MSCYRCAEGFKFFKKEIGCGNCGFSFCSKCCNNKISVPKKNNKVLNVCSNCFKLITDENNSVNNNQQFDKDTSPPKNFLKLVESNREKHIQKQSDPINDLQKRLENLNNQKNQPNVNSKTQIQDQKDLEARLNKLQGRSETSEKLSNLPTKDVINTPEDLISKLTQEVSMDKEYEEFEKKELEKLENRLKNLNSTSSSSTNKTDNIETLNDQKQIENLNKKQPDSTEELMKKMLQDAEASYQNKNNDLEDEDPWCCLCNKDAQLRCIDCENDFYCKRCFKQTHCTIENKHHKTTEYKPN